MGLDFSRDSVNTFMYAIAAFVLLLAVAMLVSDLVLMLFLVLLSIGVTLFVRLTQIRAVGLEIVTFIAIVTGFAYGSVWGASIGFLLMGFHLLASQYLGIYIAWVIPEYAVLGFLAGVFSSMDIVTFGIYSAIGVNAFNIFMTLLLYRQNLAKFALFAVTNIMINIFLFSAFGAPVLGILR